MLTVGVLGASGAVGRQVAHALAGAGVTVRLGARAGVPDAPAGAEVVAVDVTAPAALRAFCAGCHLVVNCAGPSYRLSPRVAAAAVAAGAAYVDAGGDDLLRDRLSFAPVPVVLGAGQSPGLSGLLPRWLRGTDGGPVGSLRAWFGGLDRFSPAAAADMVASLHDGYGEAMAGWRDGAAAPRTVEPLLDVSLPPFPGRVTAYPFLTGEARRLAVELGVRDGAWFNVFAGRQTLAVLNRLRAGTVGDPAGSDAAGRLVRAAEVDLAGQRPYQLMVVEITDDRGARTLTLRADDGYRLTATVAVEAAAAVLAGTVPPGAWLAADLLDPAVVVERLRRDAACTVFEVTDGPRAAAVEEGVL
ncbi:saccharopine dehydrogenase NADP-binding domain-containing protein [Polymorphospora lycopeni]|uniref:Saccharopine dehydrogenase NADP-binding domain-containing protein n=1 Tax=Polymorphospora lycopeni TaxID=3140240 RepID=A0ABV5D5E8_9ACTN